jgi:adenosylhomocysteine nucleosidase
MLSALPAEISLLVESLESKERADLAGWPAWHGTMGTRRVVLAQAGFGKVNTAALTALVWERYRPSLFIFTGVAGALDPDLGIGDIVVGDRSIQHDAGVVSAAGLEVYQPGHVPFLNPTDLLGYSPSERLLETMRSVVAGVELSSVLGRQPKVVFGTILTGDYFLQDPTTRDRLRSALDGLAIEMEGAALAQVATRLGADHVVVRALSDLAGEEAIEDFDRFLPEVAANSAGLVLAFIERLEEHDGDNPVGA